MDWDGKTNMISFNDFARATIVKDFLKRLPEKYQCLETEFLKKHNDLVIEYYEKIQKRDKNLEEVGK